MQQKRNYTKVSDEKRSLLIDLMSQNDQMTLHDASNLVEINYECSKSIWSVFRSQGRKYNLKTQRFCHPSSFINSQCTAALPSMYTLSQFERASESLKRQAVECHAHDTGRFLAFRAKILMAQKRQTKFHKKGPTGLLEFMKVSQDVLRQQER